MIQTIHLINVAKKKKKILLGIEYLRQIQPLSAIAPHFLKPA